MNNNSLLRQVMLAFYLLLFTLVSGCGSSSHSDPARYNLQFQAHPQINSSAPLKVRVLVLKSDAEFMSADFYSLQNNAQKILAGNLLNSDEFFLMPGQLAKKLSGQSSPEARYIGVMAEYQSLDGKKWRISLPLPTSGETPFWQFWKLSADQLQANLYLDVNGIRVVQQ
ncbi:TPA: type VI secretion system lipoprotein TssJ [Klebsiella aerogenes]|uniref:type VI secretion system lipoprotein TssJ n=1 Tax=Klebsiella TaxID=570 RepID=UPI00063C4C17|nr:type VI secretion system lipoprotein TssJ [Klebsiella aerogenes]EKV8806176.1 type VI secretion system lipoprotein TssJ [Klebsiella aerogenes]ELJ2006861.1 type VI secretion system lipoprotein TssJ [Klebsiella aerogenes]KLF61299.1 Type VI secretion lipoprotein/VasD [Klebsiella aerogenes]KZR02653.1 Type VI secretion lipoprotein/VasD [Klebsiella aerogenes]MDM8054441.1 type VI secretion system lipoprotein TssJ [Klebsiella aerogenes]